MYKYLSQINIAISALKNSLVLLLCLNRMLLPQSKSLKTLNCIWMLGIKKSLGADQCAYILKNIYIYFVALGIQEGTQLEYNVS